MLKPRVHIWIILALLIIVLAAGFVFMRRIDPDTASTQDFWLVYTFLFLAIFSLTALFGYFFRLIFWKNGIRYEFLRSARRQAVLFGLLAVILLFLQTREILSLWTGILLVLAFVLVEFYSPVH